MVYHASAHNAKIATYTLRDTGEGWFIEMNFAQVAVDAQMSSIHGKEELEGIEGDRYKQLFLKYLHDNFHLEVDGKHIELETGGILLGSHQTDVKFVLPQIPDAPKVLSIYLPMFEEVYNQTNLFRIYRGGDQLTKFFLSTDNDFRAYAQFVGNQVITVSQPASNDVAMISGGLVVLFILLFFIKKLSSKSKNPEFSKA